MEWQFLENQELFPVCAEGRSQSLMPVDYVLQCQFHAVLIEGSGQAQRYRFVITTIGIVPTHQAGYPDLRLRLNGRRNTRKFRTRKWIELNRIQIGFVH